MYIKFRLFNTQIGTTSKTSIWHFNKHWEKEWVYDFVWVYLQGMVPVNGTSVLSTIWKAGEKAVDRLKRSKTAASFYKNKKKGFVMMCQYEKK